jgi:hypothetical protein
LTWNLGAPQTADRKIDVRFRDFQDQTSLATVTKINVAYFFHCNGRYESDPLDVRRRLQNLLESHGYYAKIELMTQIQDRNEAIAQMQGFLTTALPNIERCFPKWPPVQAETSAPAASALAEQKS